VIELRSKTDKLKDLRAKMQEYLDNGTQLGWFIDPIHERVKVYRN
jgi:Uma2 family endonuclease